MLSVQVNLHTCQEVSRCLVAISLKEQALSPMSHVMIVTDRFHFMSRNSPMSGAGAPEGPEEDGGPVLAQLE